MNLEQVIRASTTTTLSVGPAFAGLRRSSCRQPYLYRHSYPCKGRFQETHEKSFVKIICRRFCENIWWENNL